jgi:hypothetical protein
MSSIYKELVESFGYTPVMEAVSLDTIMAAVGQEKDEQKRAAALNDIAWKENLPGLYDPVSGSYVRKQSMPAGRGNPRYNIAATASKGDDEVLSSKGLIPNNASTSTAIGRMIRGDDKKQYDQDVRTRSQAAVGNKPPAQAAQAAQPGGVTDAGSEFGTKDAFDAKAHNDLANAMAQHGANVQQRQGSDDMAAKRQRYAELLAKAKGDATKQASVRSVDNAIAAKGNAPVSNTKSDSSTLVAGIPVIPGQPLNPVQMGAAKMMLDMGNKLSPEVQAAYDLANKK